MGTVKKILAISTTGIGNMVLYTPVLKTLKSWYPESFITLLCGSPQAAEVVKGSGMADDIWVLDKSKSGSYIKILGRAKKEKFDMAVTSYLDKSFKVGVFVWTTGARIRLGYDCGLQKIFYNCRAQLGEKEHEVRQNLRLLRAFDDKKDLISDIEFFLDSEYESIKGLPIGFHPGSGVDIGGGVLKRWAIEKFAQVADRLAAKYDAEIVVFGGPGEESSGSAMQKNMDVKPIDLTGRLSLKKTAALIRKCKLFISNDSGLMHIAASFGVPVAAVFGPTLYWKNYPWDTRYRIMKKDLDCSPCYQFKNINCKYARCMEEITVDEVYEACVELMREENNIKPDA